MRVFDRFVRLDEDRSRTGAAPGSGWRSCGKSLPHTRVASPSTTEPAVERWLTGSAAAGVARPTRAGSRPRGWFRWCWCRTEYRSCGAHSRHTPRRRCRGRRSVASQTLCRISVFVTTVSLIAHQVLEQAVFARRQRDRCVGALHHPPRRIQRQRARGQHRGTLRGAAPHQRPQPRDEHDERERLGRGSRRRRGRRRRSGRTRRPWRSASAPASTRRARACAAAPRSR